MTDDQGRKAREARVPAAGKPRLTESAARVVQPYEERGKPEEATAWRARLALPAEGSKP